MSNRQLYQCLQAKCLGSHIYCKRGHKLGEFGHIQLRRLARGDPLEFGICQHCTDFDYMGEPLDESERGWLLTPKHNHAKNS